MLKWAVQPRARAFYSAYCTVVKTGFSFSLAVSLCCISTAFTTANLCSREFNAQKKLICYYHGLSGSASPVLTATCFVNGRRQFSTSHRIHTRWPITKNLVQMITSAAPMAVWNLCKSTHGASGQISEIKRIFLYLFIYFIHSFIYLNLFSGTHLQVRPFDGFSRFMAQMTRTHVLMCLLGVSLILLSILNFEGEIPESPI